LTSDFRRSIDGPLREARKDPSASMRANPAGAAGDCPDAETANRIAPMAQPANLNELAHCIVPSSLTRG